MSEFGGVGVGEVISIFAGVGGPRKATAKAGSSPGFGPVRNDKSKVEGEQRFAGRSPFGKTSGQVRARQAVPATQTRSSTIDLLGMEPKELGEIAEAEFLNTVLRLGIGVAKPWGENRGYDFILDCDGKLTRVQVKAAFRAGEERGYSLRAYRSSQESYTARDMDVLAGYVDPEKVWYLFPVRAIRKLRSLKLFPGSKLRRSKHEKWREAWWLLRK